jgi:DNA-binding NarL/FixJ family response regulator
MLAVIPRLQATGRSGLGVVAYRLAAERLRAIGELEEAARADAEREAFIARLPRRAFDATRFNATAVNLTGREREISRLVAGGLSNPQIASRLVLSVRTVESHLHRIMRKTGTANRGELAAYVRSLAA